MGQMSGDIFNCHKLKEVGKDHRRCETSYSAEDSSVQQSYLTQMLICAKIKKPWSKQSAAIKTDNKVDSEVYDKCSKLVTRHLNPVRWS